MSTQPVTESDRARQARQYIDDVMKINSQFGMANVTSEDAYNVAVSEAEHAFKWVQTVRPGGQ